MYEKDFSFVFLNLQIFLPRLVKGRPFTILEHLELVQALSLGPVLNGKYILFKVVGIDNLSKEAKSLSFFGLPYLLIKLMNIIWILLYILDPHLNFIFKLKM
jgi:hypothetical protein